MIHIGDDLIRGLLFMVLSVVLFYISKVVKDYLTPYEINTQLRESNIAVSVSLAGYLLATVIVLLGAFLGPSGDLLDDVYGFIGYAVLGIVLLNISRVINDKLLLRKFCNIKEIVEDRNAGAGAVEFGSYVASGLVVAGSIHGVGGGIHTAIAFFVLSQIVLILFSFLYDMLTPFNVHDEIEKDNVAAGVAFGGTLVAVGIILFGGSVGDFISWKYNLTNFAVSAGASFVLLPVIRIILDKIMLPKTDLNHAISRDRNIAVGLLEMTVVISFAIILYFTIDFHIGI